MTMPTYLVAIFAILLGAVLLNIAETVLVGVLLVSGGLYLLDLPRFIDPRNLVTTGQ